MVIRLTDVGIFMIIATGQAILQKARLSLKMKARGMAIT